MQPVYCHSTLTHISSIMWHHPEILPHSTGYQEKTEKKKKNPTVDCHALIGPNLLSGAMKADYAFLCLCPERQTKCCYNLMDPREK